MKKILFATTILCSMFLSSLSFSAPPSPTEPITKDGGGIKYSSSDSKISNYEVLSIRFFEGGNPAPKSSERIYTNSFDKETTRYVYTELKVNNLQYKANTHKHEIVWIYYNPDNTLKGRIQGTFNIIPNGQPLGFIEAGDGLIPENGLLEITKLSYL